jgi:hypothetical protein
MRIGSSASASFALLAAVALQRHVRTHASRLLQDISRRAPDTQVSAQDIEPPAQPQKPPRAKQPRRQRRRFVVVAAEIGYFSTSDGTVVLAVRQVERLDRVRRKK